MTKDHWPTLWFFLFMKLSQQINHHPYPWALHPSLSSVAVLSIVRACTLYILRRTSIHTFTLVICVYVFGSDEDIAMALCNGLFFITFASPSPLLTPLAPFHSLCNNGPCVLYSEFSVRFGSKSFLSLASHEIFLQNLCRVILFWLDRCSVFYSVTFQFIASKFFIR